MAEDVISKLQSLKAGVSECESLLLNPLTGDPVPISKEAIRKCPYFESYINDHPDLSEFTANAQRETLTVFAAFVSGKDTGEQGDTFDQLLFANRIGWDEFARHCCEIATKIRAPPHARPEEVCIVVHALFTYLPTRTSEHYEPILNLLTANLTSTEKDQVIDAAVETITTKRDPIDPLPIPLFLKKVTIALMKDMHNKNVVAVLHKKVWLAHNIFGPNFCPFKEEVEAFHLVFGKYVLYKRSDTSVCLKYLLTEDAPQTLFPACKFFRSRCNLLHVAVEDASNKTDSLYEWNHATVMFDKKFTHPLWKIRTAHKRANGNLAIVFDGCPSIEFHGTVAVKGRDNVADYIDDCVLEIGKTEYNVKDETLHPPLNAGYNNLSVEHIANEMYVTHLHDGKWHRQPDDGSSNIHGPVRTFTDVLLL